MSLLETESIWNIRKMNKIILLKKALMSVAGIFVMAQGVSIFLMLGVGVDPISVFLDGMSLRLGISFGSAQTLLNIIMIVISLIFFRDNIGVSTVLALFFLGPFFDLIIFLEQNMIHPQLALGMKGFLTVIGQLFFSLGVALYLSSSMGGSPCDTPGVAIAMKKGWRYGTVRLVTDFLYFLFGFLLGGTVGFGTVCCVLCTGPVSQLFLPACNRLSKRISRSPAPRNNRR